MAVWVLVGFLVVGYLLLLAGTLALLHGAARRDLAPMDRYRSGAPETAIPGRCVQPGVIDGRTTPGSGSGRQSTGRPASSSGGTGR